MEYDVSIDHERKIIVTTCRGTLDRHSAAIMARDVRKQAYDMGYGLFYDVTDLTLDMTIAQVYTFPREIRNAYLDPRHHFSRTAVLIQPGRDEETWKFYETTARNTGGVIRIFIDKDEALKWLVEGASS